MPLKIKGLTSGSVVIKAPDTGADDIEYDIANDFASTARVNAVGGRKNLLINGAMQVAQRGTSFTNPVSGAIILDRWTAGIHTTLGDGNYTQQTDVPTAAEAGTNFVKSLKFNPTTIDIGTATNRRYYTIQKIEGSVISPAGFGQAGVRYMTLSFWHKHTKTGIHCVSFNNADRNRSYPMEYIQSTTNTWEKATLTFPVDTSGNWPTDNNSGAWLFFGTAFGSNYAGTKDTWNSSQTYGTANQVNNMDSTSNNMLFTGIQLELGSVATDFEHRSYGEELALCQRYYQFGSTGTTYSGFSNGANQVYFTVPLTTPLRASPTVTRSVIGGNWTAVKHNGYNNSTTEPAVVTYVSGAKDISMKQIGHSGLSDMYVTNIYTSSSAILFDAEL